MTQELKKELNKSLFESFKVNENKKNDQSFSSAKQSGQHSSLLIRKSSIKTFTLSRKSSSRTTLSDLSEENLSNLKTDPFLKYKITSFLKQTKPFCMMNKDQYLYLEQKQSKELRDTQGNMNNKPLKTTTLQKKMLEHRQKLFQAYKNMQL